MAQGSIPIRFLETPILAIGYRNRFQIGSAWFGPGPGPFHTPASRPAARISRLARQLRMRCGMVQDGTLVHTPGKFLFGTDGGGTIETIGNTGRHRRWFDGHRVSPGCGDMGILVWLSDDIYGQLVESPSYGYTRIGLLCGRDGGSSCDGVRECPQTMEGNDGAFVQRLLGIGHRQSGSLCRVLDALE